MNITEKGAATKQKIIDAAKTLFYEQGYTKTTVAQITKKAQVNNGLFTYYFGSKTAIAGQISTEFRLNIRNLISKKIYALHVNYDFAVGIAVEHRVNMRIRANNKNILKFDNEQQGEMYHRGSHQRNHFYQLQKRLINPDISDTDLKLYEILGIQIIRSMYAAYESGLVDCDIEYLTDYYIDLLLHLLQVDKIKADSILEESKELANQIEIIVGPNFTLS